MSANDQANTEVPRREEVINSDDEGQEQRRTRRPTANNYQAFPEATLPPTDLNLLLQLLATKTINTEEQLAGVNKTMQMLATLAAGGTRDTTLVPTGSKAKEARIPNIKWADMAKLDTSKPEELDAWFIQFEQRVRKYGVTEDLWVAAFVSCEACPAGIRNHLLQEGEQTYKELRRAALKAYGLIEPVSELRLKINTVQGRDRDEVQNKLLQWMLLYNRAVEDYNSGHRVVAGPAAEIPPMQRFELVAPFVAAFPSAARVELQKHLRAAYASPDPLTYLYDYAPRAATSGALATVSRYVVEEQESPRHVHYSTPAALESTDALRAHVRAMESKMDRMLNAMAGNRNKGAPPKKQGFNRVQKGPGKGAPHGNGPQRCDRCGNNCPPDKCPAMGAVCNKCGKKNHWERVCRQRSSGPGGQRAPTSGANAVAMEESFRELEDRMTQS